MKVNKKKNVKKVQHKKRSRHPNKGTIYVIILLVLLALTTLLLAGGKMTQFHQNILARNSQVIILTPVPQQAKDSLQLYTFTGVTVTPTPTPFPRPPITSLAPGVPNITNNCTSNPFNEEPDIFLASDPASGGIAKPGGQITVWVDDGNGGAIAPGEIVDKSTGRITTPGDRSATDGKGPNYYLWEPALYITPLTSPNQIGPYSGDVENGGKPYFPVIIKGGVSYADTDSAIILPPIDPPVNVVAGRKGHGGIIAQFVWDVNSLGLRSGYYRVQMVVHDGDGDLAINCTTIQI